MGFHKTSTAGTNGQSTAQVIMQPDGNLVLYNLAVTPAQMLWSTNTAITPFSPGVALVTLYTYDALGQMAEWVWVNRGSTYEVLHDPFGQWVGLT